LPSRNATRSRGWRSRIPPPQKLTAARKVANSGSFIFPEVVEAGELISVRPRELAGGEVKV
jgi:hypothetical protein